MAKYNTFVLIGTKSRRVLLVTSSARKARDGMVDRVKCEIWNENERVQTIYCKDGLNPFLPFVADEKNYIREKQAERERKNRLRRQ